MLNTRLEVESEARVALLQRIRTFLNRKCLHGYFYLWSERKAQKVPENLRAEITTLIADVRVAFAEVLTSLRLFCRAKSQCGKALKDMPQHLEAQAALERAKEAAKTKAPPAPVLTEPFALAPSGLPTVSAFSTAFEQADGGATLGVRSAGFVSNKDIRGVAVAAKL